MVLAEVAWPIVERIPLPGGLEISPHGIMVALGFLLGAQAMLRRAQLRGMARRPIEDIPDKMQALVMRAAIGGILGARIGYIVTHAGEFASPVEWLLVWRGGLSLIGGITGAILLLLPWLYRERLDVRLVLDSGVVGLALGIFIGRVGDLIIGEHLGGRTDFLLGWRCTAQYVRGEGFVPPDPFIGPQVQGCFDAAVHQTAFYDFLAGGLIFALLVLLERKPRFDGFFALVFGVGYGAFRFVSDFAREADRDLVGTLTGSQVAALAVLVVACAWLVAVKPWRRTPWAWSPPDFERPWDVEEAAEEEPAEEEAAETTADADTDDQDEDASERL